MGPNMPHVLLALIAVVVCADLAYRVWILSR